MRLRRLHLLNGLHRADLVPEPDGGALVIFMSCGMKTHPEVLDGDFHYIRIERPAVEASVRWLETWLEENPKS